MTDPNSYDYIVAGSGCAGLSLLVHMIRSGGFSDKRILLIDREIKDRNDRTWCFWETQPGPFESVVSKSWNRLWFRSESVSRLLDIAPYQYKLIRGIDFYKYALESIHAHPGITKIREAVEEVGEDAGGPFILVAGKKIRATIVFNSILFSKPVLRKNEYYLLQHFKGWFIETESDRFDPSQASLMDFRISQRHGTAFVYVMPFSKRSALIEYTLFTRQLLTDGEYDEGLKNYVSDVLSIDDYRVTESETGVIPMTNHRFGKGSAKLIQLGTAGGQTRGSTGYTFSFIQRHSAEIVSRLLDDRTPLVSTSLLTSRFAFYDSVLLDVLHHGAVPGDRVFSDMFRKNDPRAILQFLDKQSGLGEDLKIIGSLPVMPFLKAAMRHLF